MNSNRFGDGSEREKASRNLEEPDPFEIEFLPQFRENRGPKEPFVNRHGVLIGDHEYQSASSPLENWTAETDPAVMGGEEWVHPFKDIGFHTAENREYFEKGMAPQAGMFMHPDKDAAYHAYQDLPEESDSSSRKND